MQLKLSLEATASPLSIRIISYNIRYATSTPFQGEHLWPDRLPRLAKQLRYETRPFDHLPLFGEEQNAGIERTVFVGLQEVLHQQLVDIMGALNKDTSPPDTNDGQEQGQKEDKWAYIGVARDDGKTYGEYGPILYQPSQHKLLHWETIWLSPTPEKPSLGWDAACRRILTFGIFEPRVASSVYNASKPMRLMVCNTHFDHQGTVARRKAVDVVLDAIRRVKKDWNPDAVFLTGDFNSQTNQEAYKGMVEAGLLKDARECVSEDARHGDYLTYTGFNKYERKTRIDYIWVGTSDAVVGSGKHLEDDDASRKVEVKGYAVLPNLFDDGVYISDHRPVVVDSIVF